MKITKCWLTRNDATILTPWLGSNKYERYLNQDKIHTGVDVLGSTAYSICPGVVMNVYTDSDNPMRLSVLVQYDASTLFYYRNLISVSCERGDFLATGNEVGRSEKHIHLEMWKKDSSDTSYPARFFNVTYYRVDPTVYLSGYHDLYLGSDIIDVTFDR